MEIEKKENKIEAGFRSPFLRKAKVFLRRLENILIKEIREEDFDRTWKKFIKGIRNNDFIGEEVKIFLLGILLVGSIIWMGNSEGFIFIAHSEESKITNAQIKEKIELKILGESEKRIDVKSVNDYKVSTSEEECQEAKKQKQSSGLCGKDDEEELKRIALEEERKRIAAIKASRPKIVSAPMPVDFKVVGGRRVCSKSNDHPGKSKKGKGKHMDMECCLDPDEYPNPNCYYDPKKYGKYL